MQGFVERDQTRPGEDALRGAMAVTLAKPRDDSVLLFVATRQGNMATFTGHRRAAGVIAYPCRHAETATGTEHSHVAATVFAGLADFHA